jgi:fucose permease
MAVVRPHRRVERARVSVSLAFMLHAAVCGTWGPRVPAIKADAHMTDGQLGLAFFAMAVGLVAGTRSASLLVERYGSRRVLRTTVPVVGVLLVPLGFAETALVVGTSLLVWGLVAGIVDVAMNGQGVAVEMALGRPAMSTMHALWSVGLGIGAAVATLCATAGVAPRWHFIVVAVAVAAVSLAGLRALLPTDAAATPTAPDGTPAAPAGLWSAGILMLGAIVFCSFIVEGATADWGAVFLRQELDASAGLAASAFAAYTVGMALSRFTADRAVAVVGPVRLVRTASLVATLALACGLVIGEPAAMIVAFAVAGAGIGPAVPLAFSAAGRQGGRHLARVVTIAYLGSVLGPLFIGGLSELTDLRVAFWLPVVLFASVAVSARWLAGTHPH